MTGARPDEHYLPEQDDGQQLYDFAAGLAAYAPEQEQEHMKIDALLPSRFLKQADIDGEQLVTVTEIKKSKVSQDDEPDEYKFVLHFKELDRGMVLNATNIKRLGKALGNDTDDWIGGQVILYVDENIEYAGNIVGGLRIRAATKHSVTHPRTKPSADDINRKLRDAQDDPPF